MDIGRRLRRLFTDRRGPVILMFHRIAEPACDPWALAVAPSLFEEQMQLIKERRVPFSVADLVARLEDGTLPPLAAAVTFDDGYVDNLRVAKPILHKVGVPATVFLTTGYLGKRQEFWWDELARMILVRQKAAEGTLVIGDQSVDVHLPAVDRATRPSAWRAWEPPRTARERLYIDVWSRLRVLQLSARERGMEEVRRLFSDESASESDFPMAPEDVQQLVSGGNIDVGAHSETHQPLTTLSEAERRNEIEQSRAACEALVGKRIEGFAYPHGDLDPLSKSLVRESGLQWACSTESAAIDRTGFDLFSLPRVQALNWTASQLKQVLDKARYAA